MKKSLCFKTIWLLIPLVGCSLNDRSSSNSNVLNNEILVSKVIKAHDKNYVEVDGKPFNYNGIQIRQDWLINEQGEEIDDLDYYFQVAEDLGVKCVELPLRWKDLEPREGAYDFRDVAKMMKMAKDHNLRIEFLLFGVNIGGMTGTVPDYIKSDKQKYPQRGNTLNHPDALFFVQDNPNILEREKLCASALMDAIYNWSLINNYNAVMAIQIRNEPDLYEDRRVEHSLKNEDGTPLSADQAYRESFNAIKAIAKEVKKAKYKLITRVNVCCYSRHKELNYKWWKDLVSLDCIDIAGEDTYNPNIELNKEVIMYMKANLCDQYNTIPQIAENTGHYLTNPEISLMVNMLGGSYDLYDMITPSVITDSWGYNDWGLLNNKTKQPKEAYPNMVKVYKGINYAGPLFPIVKSENIALFNITENGRKNSLEQTIKTEKTTYKFTTNDNALAYAINYNGYVYLWSDNPCSILIENTTLGSIMENGYINTDGTFIPSNSSPITIESNKLDLVGNAFYRIEAKTTSNQISNTIENIY